METRHEDSDGSDIFWPGYVDAVTNLVLNLLFLLTIMTVAVFMFALELGRASKGGADKSLVSSKQSAAVSAKATDPAKENIELKREIQRLNAMLAQRVPQQDQASGLAKTVDVTSTVPQPPTGIAKTVVSDFVVEVRFTEDAVAFTPDERERLLESLKPIVANGKSTIFVAVPAGFSEAKRMGFYRAMAVRNLLLELQMPKQNINVTVLEGDNDANAALVKVR